MSLNASDLAALSRLLDQAIELEGAQREAWFANLPEDDQHLAPMLREVLTERDNAQTSGFISSMPELGSLLVKYEEIARVGELIGPYRLIREIGRGGMGAVWLAERADGTFKRQIAVKLPRLAWGVGLAERMSREREIGALLEHPNIARLYDAGRDEQGRPYLALEYIDGVQIDTWCAARALGVPARMRLFVQVVRAVAYAHGRLVVHRDLKPSNVLVTADGQAHLLDFGIAKLMNEASLAEVGLTQEHGRALTLHYASPEQISGGAITVGSDVYSLGVLLYELLTGQLPHAPRRGTLGALEDAILQSDAPMASSRAGNKILARALRGEIDAILGKAMQREASRRYATADALADDIEKHLRGEPIAARPDSAFYRSRRVVRRNWVGILAVSAVLTAVLMGAGVSVAQANKATRAAERERVVKDFVADVFRFSAISPTVNADLRRLPAEMLLEHGANLIQSRFPGQPDIQAELYGVVGGVFADMSAYKLAIEYSTRQIEALDLLPAEACVRVRALAALAEALLNSGRYSDAALRAERAVQLAQQDKTCQVEAHVMLARTLKSMGRKADAISSLTRAEALIAGGLPAHAGPRAWLTTLKADLTIDDSRFDLQLPRYLEAIAQAETGDGADSRAALDLKLRLGRNLIITNRLSEALAIIEPALAGLESLGGANAVRAAYERALLWETMTEVDAIPAADALAVIRRSKEIINTQTTLVPIGVRLWIDLAEGLVLISQGNVKGLPSNFGQTLSQIRKTEERASHTWYMGLFADAEVALISGKHELADERFREALQSRVEMGHGNSPYAAMDHGFLAVNKMMQGDYAAAQAVLDATPSFPPMVGDPSGASSAYSEIVAWQRARLMLLRGDRRGALAAVENLGAPDSLDYPYEFALEALRGEVMCAAGHNTKGLALLKMAIRARAARAIPGDPTLARHRAVAGSCSLGLGDRGTALQLARQARAGFEAQPNVSPHFKAPLLELERSLGLRLLPVWLLVVVAAAG